MPTLEAAMKEFHRVSTLLMSALFLTARGWGQSSATKSVETRSATGRFVVRAPVALVEVPRDTSRTITFYGAAQGGRFVYVVAYTDLDAQTTAETALDWGVHALGGGSDSSEISSTKIALDGYPGREAVTERRMDEGSVLWVVRARLFVVHNRSYQVLHGNRKGDVDPNGDAFLQSFRLLE
jgi:hypothetical protein